MQTSAEGEERVRWTIIEKGEGGGGGGLEGSLERKRCEGRKQRRRWGWRPFSGSDEGRGTGVDTPSEDAPYLPSGDNSSRRGAP